MDNLLIKTKPHYTYTLAYPDGKVFYVGKGVGDRINDHEREAATDKTHNTYKVRIIRKIWGEGGEVVKTILAYFETHEEACMYEIALIFFMDGLTNLTRGGDGVLLLTRTEEHKRKIGEAHKGRKASDGLRQKLSEIHKKDLAETERIRQAGYAHRGKPSWNKGKPQSEEHRRHNGEARKGIKRGPRSPEAIRKGAEANRGKKRTEEQRRKMGDSRRGIPIARPRSEEYRRKMSESHKGKPGHPRSPEALRKFSETMKGHTVSEETRQKISELAKARYASPEARQKLSEAAKRREARKRASGDHNLLK